jgi:hypothetical protein
MDARIRALEREIASWGATNSQSNPGAVMELRSMRRELRELEAIQKLSYLRPAVKEAKVVKEVNDPKKDETGDR